MWLTYCWNGIDSSVYKTEDGATVIKFWKELGWTELRRYFLAQNRLSDYVRNEKNGKIDRVPWDIFLAGSLIREINLRVLRLDLNTISEISVWDGHNTAKCCPQWYKYRSCSSAVFVGGKTIEDHDPNGHAWKRLVELLEAVVEESDILVGIPEGLIARINVKASIQGKTVDLVITDLAASVQDVLDNLAPTLSLPSV